MPTRAAGDIVITRDSLPVVDPELPSYSGYVGLDGPGSADSHPIALHDVAWHMNEARRQLAIALYLTDHPTIEGTPRV